jgi:hypothetical protein
VVLASFSPAELTPLMPETYDQWEDFPEETPDLPLSRCPCPFPPGTREKEMFMRWRWLRGKSLHHPDDERLPDSVGFEPVPGFRDGEFFRGLLLSQEPEGTVVVPDQMERPASRRYSDGPGMKERRKRAKARQQDPEQKQKDAARKRASRAFQKRKRQHRAAAAEAALPSLSASR